MQGLLLVDLDGTLISPGVSFAPDDLTALTRAGTSGFVRAVATGRSLFSARKALSPSFPIDYLVFSSGAGIVHWPSGKVVRARSLEKAAILESAAALIACDLDFMIHEPIPDNHRFVYRSSSSPTADFFRRLELYRDYARPVDPGAWPEIATQLLAIAVGDKADSIFARLAESRLPVSLVRATSPLTPAFAWIELYPTGVTKGEAAQWMAEWLGMGDVPTIAVGNDYNDIEMLRWARHPFVVAGAPETLRQEFPVLAASASGGLSEALAKVGI